MQPKISSLAKSYKESKNKINMKLLEIQLDIRKKNKTEKNTYACRDIKLSFNFR